MTPQEAVLYLRARAKVQREQKTSYNRLRWTQGDLDAVDALLDFLLKKGRRAERDEARG